MLLAFFVIVHIAPAQTHYGAVNSRAKNDSRRNSKIVRTYGTKGGVVTCELVDNKGNLWFSISGEGAYCFDGKSFINFNTRDGLCNNEVSAIIEDRAGNILFGTNIDKRMFELSI